MLTRYFSTEPRDRAQCSGLDSSGQHAPAADDSKGAGEEDEGVCAEGLHDALLHPPPPLHNDTHVDRERLHVAVQHGLGNDVQGAVQKGVFLRRWTS
ncbi:Protein of unknown function [Gryllus bimaculatus]|nr:Protein of unknown function [Gryllus bimaculatus]